MSELPPPASIANRDAHRLALVLEELSATGERIAGGWAAWDADGSWADYAAGLGLDGPVTDPELDRLVAFYEEAGHEPRIQITAYQHPSLVAGLAKRGFVPYELETVLAISAQSASPSSPFDRAAVTPPAGLRFVPVDGDDPTSVAAFVRSQFLGFFGAVDAAPRGMHAITARVAAHPRARLWLAELDGEVVGSGGLERFGSSAVLIAGCVHEGARRRGVHQAFLQHRLSEAAAEGVSYCLIGSLAGGPDR
ncbi:MAG: GNAT family N-acetyltransferase, partial [Deltaproteobacteria bacterium]|nr:GNAT family N-acetyltransferase [Deltaproteobacteria bacterium]